MDLTELFSQGLAFIGPFDFRVILFLFLLTLLGEAVGFFIPYLFEASWISIGYQFSHGVMSPYYLIVLLFTCIAGRQFGALFLYFISRSSSALLTRYTDRFMRRVNIDENRPMKIFRKIDITASPFSVALGRLLWLRIPLTLILGVRRKLGVLMAGVAISSIIYEGMYVTLGAVAGTTTSLDPLILILYSLIALTVIWSLTFGIRRLIGMMAKSRLIKRDRYGQHARDLESIQRKRK